MGRKAEVQRMMLEKLMGPEAMGASTQQIHFTDDKACKNFLCGTCPHDLFSNTKVDLGVCPRSHLSRLKDEYTVAVSKGEQYPTFEAEYEDNIRAFMADIDRKIAANKRRIDQTPEETQKFSDLMRDIADVEKALNDAMTEVERLGEAGQIEESLAELQKAEALKGEKADRERELQALSDSAGASGHQKLRVCDVCGAYLSILDSDRRLADHFGGRMHLGYVKLRDVIADFDARRDRGDDPRRKIAAGIGWRPSRREPEMAGRHAHHPAPPPMMGGGGYGGANGSYGTAMSSNGRGPPPSFGAAPPRYGSAVSGGHSSSSSSDPYRRNDDQRFGGSDRDRDRDRDRRDRREGRDYRDRDRQRSRSPPSRAYR